MTDIRPNFVVIMTDSQGANVIGCYGDTRMQTPCIDKLASEGVRFSRAYNACPVCTPARGAIFTGIYPHSNGAWANEMTLYSDVKTLGERLRDSGYRTAYIGKWHLSGQDYFDKGEAPPGWDPEYWYDGRNYMDDLTDEQRYLWRQVLHSTEALMEHDVAAEFTWANHISHKAMQFLAEAHDRPFLLVLSYDEPHGPCTAPREYVERFKDFVWDPGPSKHDLLSDKPASHRRYRDMSVGIDSDGMMRYPPFFACNSFVDTEIGSVVDKVDEIGGDSTYVLFTSDHGQFMGAHGLQGKGTLMYEENVRVPLIVRSPDRAHAGRVDDTIVGHTDIVPTVLELACIEIPPIIDGESLASNIREGTSKPEKVTFIEWSRDDVDLHVGEGFYPVRCLRKGDYKLVINLKDSDEFYNLANDPHELTNAINAPDTAVIRDEMHDDLVRWQLQVRDPFRGHEWCERPWHISKVIETSLQRGSARPPDGYSPPTLDYNTGLPWPENGKSFGK